MQVLLQIRNNFIVIETGQSETSLRLTQSNLLDQVIRQDDLTSKQRAIIALLLAVSTSRFIDATALHRGAEVVDTGDSAQIIGEVVGAVVGNISKEESDGIS